MIAKLAQCKVHAFLSVYKELSEDGEATSRRDSKHKTLVEHKAWLDELAEPFREAGVKFSHEVDILVVN